MATQDFNVGSFTNVILRYPNDEGQDSEIKCHRAVLSWKSTYFKIRLDKQDSEQVNIRWPISV